MKLILERLPRLTQSVQLEWGPHDISGSVPRTERRSTIPSLASFNQIIGEGLSDIPNIQPRGFTTDDVVSIHHPISSSKIEQNQIPKLAIDIVVRFVEGCPQSPKPTLKQRSIVRGQLWLDPHPPDWAHSPAWGSPAETTWYRSFFLLIRYVLNLVLPQPIRRFC
jgi:hypothetical protein